MAAIVEELIIAAAPQSVFNALTQQDELARWWTNDLNARICSPEMKRGLS